MFEDLFDSRKNGYLFWITLHDHTEKTQTERKAYQIDAEFRVRLIGKQRLDALDLLSEHFRCKRDTADGAKPAGVGDGGDELVVGNVAHARQHDRVATKEEMKSFIRLIIFSRISTC